MALTNDKEKVLEVNNLRVSFKTDHGIVKAVRGVSFDLYKGETLCIVGESGSGKSVSSKAIMGILANNSIVEDGTIMYEGENLLEVSEEEYVNIRGKKIGMIFQDPLSSLNPIVKIGKQITEATILNGNRVKQLFNKTINDENIAYKNLITFKKIRTAKIKAKLEHDIDELKNGHQNKFKKDLAKLKQLLERDLYNIGDKAEFEIIDIKDDTKDKVSEIKSKKSKAVESLKSKLDVEIAKLEGAYDSKRDASGKLDTESQNTLNGSIANLKEACNQKISEISAGYDKQIENLKTNASSKIEIIKTKRDEELKACKDKYNADVTKCKEEASSKAALIEKEAIQKQIAELKANAKTEIDKINEEYNAKMPAVKENLKNAKAKAKVVVSEYKQKVKLDYATDLENAVKKHEEEINKINSEYQGNLESALEAVRNTDKSNVEHYNSVKNQYDQLYKEFKDKVLAENERYVADVKAAKTRKVSSLKITKKEAKAKALEIMKEVGIPYPEKRFKQYPFEFSGGMRQRIVIAIALTASPDVLICDEPTTALDVTIQAQILELINKLKRERNLSVIFITHDLGVVANMADRVAVMYAGKIVEYGNVEEIFYEPKHPYTWALLSSIPDVDSKERLEAIPGTPPNLVFPPKGDAFADRSRYAMEIDYKAEPPYFKVSDTHYAATWLLAPGAPKVEMPKIVSERIRKSLEGGNK